MHALDFRPVGFALGLLVIAVGVAMLAPALVDRVAGDDEWLAFVRASAITVFFGGLLAFSCRVDKIELSLRAAFVLTTLGWVLTSLFAALPLYMTSIELSVTDAVFEAVSGLTTTGSTVISGLDHMPPGILLWRSLMQWLGGIGIIVMAVAILPYLKVGGMQLFKMESSDTSEKALPKAAQIATATVSAYILLTLSCFGLYWAFGMTSFEAVAHAMTTLATGGYSTSDSSMGAFNPSVQWTGTLFMLLGGLPFLLYFRAVTGGSLRIILKDPQVRAFLTAVGVLIAALTLWLTITTGEAPLDALRLVAFNVVSVITTTGFATTDYTVWGSFALMVFFFLTFVGGCTGSTSGGVKILRFQFLFMLLRRQMHRLLYPHAVTSDRYAGIRLSEDLLFSAAAFIFIFFLGFWGTALALSLMGLDYATSLSGAATAVANVGPGVGPIIGPAGNFSSLPDAAKLVLCGAMLLGRLEFMTITVLLTRYFWRG